MIPADAKLTPRDPAFPAWDSLPPEQKRIFSRQMEVFAGFLENADYQIGRVIMRHRRAGAARQYARPLHLRRQRRQHGRDADRNIQ